MQRRTVGFLLGFLLAVHEVSAVSIANAKKQIADMQNQIDKYQIHIDERGVSGRIEQAKTRFSSRDYAGVVYGLYPLLGMPGFERHTEYVNAVAMFAEALYQEENFLVSRRYFAELSKKTMGDNRDVAFIRLMQIAYKYHDVENFNRYYDQYAKLHGNIPFYLLSLKGRLSFILINNKSAKKELEKIPVRSTYGLRAKYIIGASYVRENNIKEALPYFMDIMKARPVVAPDADVVILATLAYARLSYENGDYDNALAAYQKLESNSRYGETALYEESLTYLRYGDALRDEAMRMKDKNLLEIRAIRMFQEGARVLRRLYERNPKLKSSPKVRLLLAEVLVRQEDEEEAKVIFEDVLTEFNDLWETLQNPKTHAISSGELIQAALMERVGAKGEQSLVPQSVMDGLITQSAFSKVVDLYQNLLKTSNEVDNLINRYNMLASAKNGVIPFAKALESASRLKEEMTEDLRATALDLKNKVVQDADTGGRLVLVFRNKLTNARLVHAVISLDGEIIQVNDQTLKSETFQKDGIRVLDVPMQAGKHVVEVVLIARKSLADVQDAVKIEIKGRHELEAKSGQLETVVIEPSFMKNTVMQLKPNLAFHSKVQQKYPPLEAFEWAKIKELMSQEHLYQSNCQTDAVRLRQCFSFWGEEADFFATLAQKYRIMNPAFETEKSIFFDLWAQLDDLIGKILALDTLEIDKIATMAKYEGEQLAAKDKEVRRVAQEFEKQEGFLEAQALRKLSSDIGEIVLQADNGLVQTALKKKNKEAQKIKQIEQRRSAELFRLEEALGLHGEVP